jgi:hypothetical protein
VAFPTQTEIERVVTLPKSLTAMAVRVCAPGAAAEAFQITDRDI